MQAATHSRQRPGPRYAPQVERYFYLSSGHIFAALLSVNLLLAVLDAVSYAINTRIDSDQFRRIFDSDAESSVATWVSSFQALVGAFLLGLIAAGSLDRHEAASSLQPDALFDTGDTGDLETRHSNATLYPGAAPDLASERGGRGAPVMSPSSPASCRRQGMRWLVLAAIFLAVSVEEVAAVHESLTLIAGLQVRALGGSSWVIPALLAGAALLVWYAPFLRRLPVGTLRLFVAAAIIAAGSAMALDVLAALVLETPEDQLTGFGMLLANLEELGERLGIALFIYALLRYIASYTPLGRIVVPGKDAALVLR